MNNWKSLGPLTAIYVLLAIAGMWVVLAEFFLG
jgi:hypothetical protein